MNRRRLLHFLVKGGGALAAGFVAIPGLLFALRPGRKPRSDTWRSLDLLESFPVGAVHEAVVDVPGVDRSASLRRKSVYVWRPNADEVVVYSRNCTDLSCPVNYDPGSTCFFCPCHGGIFLQNGTPIAGPPRAPLYRYSVRIVQGRLEIDLNSLPPMT